jgi:hypothetical protein
LGEGKTNFMLTDPEIAPITWQGCRAKSATRTDIDERKSLSLRGKAVNRARPTWDADALFSVALRQICHNGWRFREGDGAAAETEKAPET